MPEPMVAARRRTTMTNRRLGSVASLAVALAATTAVLAGCSTGSGTTVGSDVGTQSSDAATSTPPDTRPTAPSTPPAWTGTPQQIEGARLVFFDTMDVSAADYPGPDVPLAAEVDGARELATTYAAMPGVEAAVDAVNAAPPTADERLFVFVVNPCIVEDAVLTATKDAVSVKLIGAGSKSVKCEPPPVRMAVFAVPSMSIPTSATATPPTY